MIPLWMVGILVLVERLSTTYVDLCIRELIVNPNPYYTSFSETRVNNRSPRRQTTLYLSAKTTCHLKLVVRHLQIDDVFFKFLQS